MCCFVARWVSPLLIAVVLAITLAAADRTAARTTPTPDQTPAARGSGDSCVDAAGATPMVGMHDGAGMMGAGTPMAAMTEMTPGAMGPGMMDQFDAMFIDMMIPHHESAVAMAHVALERSDREEITHLAEAIIADQTTEIEQLREWRADWYGADHPMMPTDEMIGMMGQMMAGMPEMANMPEMSGMMGMAMSPMAEVAALCDATGPFDLAFVDAMIPHHESAIAMARVALTHAQHPELRDLAQTIIDAQQQEIDKMQGWRKAWSEAVTPVP